MFLNFDYTSIFLIFINLFVFVLFIFLTFVIIRQYKVSTTEEETLIKDRSFAKAIKLLDDAQRNSLKILKDTTERSNAIIHETQFISEDSKNQLKAELSKLFDVQLSKIASTNSEFQKIYQEVLKEEKDKSLLAIKSISQEIENTAVNSVSTFNDVTKAETLDFEKRIEDMFEEERKLYRQRIAEYESKHMKDIEEKSKKLIHTVARDVFSKSITMDLHEDLVMRSLEKAKAQELFL